jgi:hypothetical protein
VNGVYVLDTLSKTFPNKIIAASVHVADPMQIPLYDTLAAMEMGNIGLPCGLVDRLYSQYSPELWGSRSASELVKTAKCGLAIKSEFSPNSDSITVEVHAGFLANLTGNYVLTTYVLEDYVNNGTSYDQLNYYSSAYPAGPHDHGNYFYYQPFVISNFQHMNVARLALPSESGEPIDPSVLVPKGQFVRTYKFAVGTCNAANVSIVSFVAKFGANYSENEIMNVQKVKAGHLKNWD